MVERVAATSLLGCMPLCGCGPIFKDVAGGRRNPADSFSFSLPIVFRGKMIASSTPPSLVKRLGFERLGNGTIRALAMELTKERIPNGLGVGVGFDTDTDRRPGAGAGAGTGTGTWPPANRADNPSLHNPLLRQERMGCGWLGAIFEWEGVIVEDSPDLEKQAWIALSQEEGKPSPLAFVLKRIEGMKNEQAISEVLCWSRDPSETRRLANRKEEIYQALECGICRLRSGSQEFVNVLMTYKIPMALVSTRPRKALESAIVDIGIEGYFNVIVAAEDVHRGKPDPEMFEYASQLLNFIPDRCIVFGNSNLTIEAAHDARMKCVAVASKHPVYELSAADLVVRRLDELSVVDLKNLADLDSPEFQSGELEVEMEEEEENQSRPVATAEDDIFW